MRVTMQDGGIRALSFRTGMLYIPYVDFARGSNTVFFFIVADGHAVLASASSTGHIALWDLNAGGRLLHLVRGAHEGAITSIEWIPGQPLLISSGEDNSVKVCSVHPTWRLQYGSMVL